MAVEVSLPDMLFKDLAEASMTDQGSLGQACSTPSWLKRASIGLSSIASEVEASSSQHLKSAEESVSRDLEVQSLEHELVVAKVRAAESAFRRALAQQREKSWMERYESCSSVAAETTIDSSLLKLSLPSVK